jgi:hypothetical protein
VSRLIDRRKAKIAENISDYLHEDEVVQATIFAQSAPGGGISREYYFVVATNERIIVFNARATAASKVKGIDIELPRDTQIGPPNGKGSLTRTWYRTDALGKRVYIPRTWWSEVRAADAASSG